MMNDNRVTMNISTSIRILFTFIGLVLVAVGFYIKSNFINGSCCDMTYSRPSFVPIAVNDESELLNFTHPRHYRLFKFRDARDPRPDFIPFDELSSDACGPNPGHPVLFIPGHWGFYEQARSLGAHGTGMTEKSKNYHFDELYKRYVKEEVNNTSFMSRLHSGDRFLYDVYTIDFGNEASAIHASHMHAQAHFVNSAIRTILKRCDYSDSETSVTLVGHSIGGVVARASVVLNTLFDESISFTRTIITLGSPHQGLPYSFDSSVNKFYYTINQKWQESNTVRDDIHVISISGGQRDELIRQDVAHCDGLHQSCLSFLATDISNLNPSSDGYVGGIDHRALCWCHNLLKTVRNLIDFTSRQSSKNSMRDIIEGIRRNYSISESDTSSLPSYILRSAEQQEHLKHSMGIFLFLALQVAMPFSSELFVVVFLYISIKHQLYRSIFESPGVFFRFIFPLIFGAQFFNVPWFALVSTVAGTYSTFSIIVVILSMMDRIKRKLSLGESLEDIFLLPQPRLTRVCVLFLLSNIFTSTILVLTSHMIYSLPITMMSFKASFFLTQLTFLLLSWLTLLLKPQSQLKPCNKNTIEQHSFSAEFSMNHHIICICLVIPFAFAGKVAYAISLLSSNVGQSTAYALIDLGDELMQASALVILPFYCFLFIAISYPFGLYPCVCSTWNLWSIDENNESEKFVVVTSKYLNICDLTVSVLTISSFRLGGGYMISWTLSIHALLQILCMLFFVQAVKPKRWKSS